MKNCFESCLKEILAQTAKFPNSSDALAYFVDRCNSCGQEILHLSAVDDNVDSGMLRALQTPLKAYPTLELTQFAAQLNEPEKKVLELALTLLPFLLENIDNRQIVAAHRFSKEWNETPDVSKILDQNAQMHLAIKASNIGLWDWHIKPNVIFFSPDWKKQLGYEVEEISNDILEWENRLHPDDREKATGYVYSFIRNPLPFYETEFRLKHKDGTYHWILSRAEMYRDEDGRPERLIGCHIDITDRKQAEEELREAKAFSEKMIETAPLAFILFDKNGDVQRLNTATEEMFGWSRDEIQQKSIMGIHSGKPEEFHKVLAEVVEKNGLKDYYISHERKDGSRIDISVSAAPILGADDEINGIVAVLADITEKSRSDEKIRRQVERLSSLRTISNAINASLNLKLVMSVFLDQVLSQLGVDAADVLLQNSFSQMLEFAGGRGFIQKNPGDFVVYLGDGVAGQVALERKLVHYQDLSLATNLRRRNLVKVEKFIFYMGIPLISKGEIKGVLEVFHRTPLQPDQEWIEFLESLANQAAIAIDNAGLFENMQYSNIELTRAYEATIEGWSRALDLRDHDTEGHTQRVAEAAVRLADAYGVNQSDLIHIRRGALLHDIGKVGIPDRILLKPGPLTEEEWSVMKQHPVLAFELLSPISFLRPAIDIPYCHHEKWDGSGYPRGLKGETIPISARIFSILDVWDALRSDRPYRKSWSKNEIEDYLRSQSGRQFEPKILEVFLHVLKSEHLDNLVDGIQ